MEFEKLFDEKEFSLELSGKFGIPEMAEMLDFLKDKKAAKIETEFKIGDRVYRYGYREYGIGEITEIEIRIFDSGEPCVTYIADSLGSGFEGEFEKI